MALNEKSNRKKYEYLEVAYVSFDDCRLVSDGIPVPGISWTVNKLGGMGFELVSIYPNGNKWPRAIFKREYDEEISNAEEMVNYECVHCGYQQKVNFIFCPKCKKNDGGQIELA